MLIAILVIVFLVVIVPILMYNGLIGKRNMVDNAFASIDTLLKKRYDLIPNLISAVKTYMQYESGTLTKITELRAKAVSATSPDEKIEIDREMSGLMRSVMVAVENYPDLKASENFLQLQAALNNTEEQIAAARRAYNAAVLDFNNAVQMFPTNIMAGMMRLAVRKFFEINEQERQNVNVGDLFKG